MCPGKDGKATISVSGTRNLFGKEVTVYVCKPMPTESIGGRRYLSTILMTTQILQGVLLGISQKYLRRSLSCV